jgi:hypothetical protein
MTAPTDTNDTGKESGDVPTLEAPSKNQIDVVFASAIEAVDGVVDDWMSDHVVSMIVAFWNTVDQLRENEALTVDSETVEDLREEHLGGQQ